MKSNKESGFSVARNEAQLNAVRQGENLSKRNKNEVFMKRSSKIRTARKIQDSGFSVACNEVKCAKVTTERNERNFFKKFLKWSYQVVTARKIQEEAQAGVEGKSLLLPETVDRRRRIIEPVKRQRSVVLQWRDTHKGRPRKSCRWQVCRGAGELRAQARMSRLAKEAFTLAEVLITLAIIGVVAAISIPSVISNSQQQEFKTGLRKAVSVLNSAITMNMALDGETPYDNANLVQFLMKHMGVIKTVTSLEYTYYSRTCIGKGTCDNNANAAFYTTDGMRFEFNLHDNTGWENKLHESDIYACTSTNTLKSYASSNVGCNGCGSYGLNSNSNNTTKPPCLILVDVNGDKKPTPGNVNCKDANCGKSSNLYKVPLPSEKKVRDIFSILITEDRAIPYGVTAQKAMYQAQK